MEFLHIANALHQDGWISCPDFLDRRDTLALSDYVHDLNAQGKLNPARIGHHATRQQDETIRGDAIAWLENGQDSRVRQLEERFAKLRQALNRELMLGLFEFEGHFALYAPGTGYRRHLDQFRDSDTRKISCVLYLNDGEWNPEDGGQLRLFLNGEADQPFIDIQPCGGTLVLFLSGRFYHEVRTTQRTRLSLTGWFRARE